MLTQWKYAIWVSMTFFSIYLPQTSIASEFKKINEVCTVMPCENGLFCVETKDRENIEKCSACDRSELDSFARSIDDYCKGYGAGWTPESSSEYKNVLADDGRVLVDIFDKLLDTAKQCREARLKRENKCWAGGDDEHKKTLKDVEDSITRITDHKYKMITDKRVYYGDPSTYKSRISTAKSKCDLNFPNMNQKIDISNREISNGNKIRCSDIEDYQDDADYCYRAVNELYESNFSRSFSSFPEKYDQWLRDSSGVLQKAKDLISTAKYKDLCD